jgi:hypothetical protein
MISHLAKNAKKFLKIRRKGHDKYQSYTSPGYHDYYHHCSDFRRYKYYRRHSAPGSQCGVGSDHVNPGRSGTRPRLGIVDAATVGFLDHGRP